MVNALTVDVEDYQSVVARDWLAREITPTRAVVDNTQRLLRLFGDREVRGTFFVLGEVAEAFPDLIREIAAAGHEIGVHGFYHRQVFKLTPEAFRKEVVDAKSLLEDICGAPVRGHRAPAFSIMPHTRWALDVLAEAGFQYDSSIFPIRGRRYGWPGFPCDIHRVNLANGGSIIEAPLSTVSLFGVRMPACGGGYLRHFPGFVTQWAFRRVQRRRPAILYLHPCEIEVNPPALDTSGLAADAAGRAERFHRRQIGHRHTVEGKIARLLERFAFIPLADVIDRVLRR